MILISIPGIKGQAAVDGHKDWLNVDSIHWGVGRAVSHTVAGSAKREVSTPSLSEVTFSRLTDMASPHLFYEACGGKQLDPAVDIEVLQITDKQPKVFVKIKLEGAIVSSYSVSSGGDNPTESFGLNFTKITFQYDTFDGKTVKPGNPRAWNLMEGKGA